MAFPSTGITERLGSHLRMPLTREQATTLGEAFIRIGTKLRMNPDATASLNAQERVPVFLFHAALADRIHRFDVGNSHVFTAAHQANIPSQTITLTINC